MTDAAEPTRWLFEDCELDGAAYELRRADQLVAMEPQVFEVLAFLVANHGRLLTKDEIIGKVWPDGFITDGALATRVMQARRAIGDTGEDQRLIRTVRGRGYSFIGTVEAIPAAALSLTGPGPADSPALPPPPAPPGPIGFDAPATSFVGRRAELQRLQELLATPGCRLLTLVGPGGIGKTRLALEALERVAATGMTTAAVALHAARCEDDLAVAISNALGLALPSPTLPAITERMGAREAVLLLDNFEHLAPDCTRPLGSLVRATPGLRLLVTSRERLGLQEEWLFPLAGLTTGEADGEAEQLFLARESQVAIESGLPDDSLASLREICTLVGGLPLALELAASLRRYLPREEILGRIQADLGVLSSDLHNLPDRHRTIPGLFDQTCSYLSPGELSSLLALSVFEGPFTPEAAAVVADAPLSTVGRLVDRSLLQARGGRLSLHPLLRQYARARLGDAYSPLQLAHAEYYSGWVASLLPELEGPGQASVSAEIDAALPNVLAAGRFAADNGRFDLVQAAAYALFLVAQMRSRWSEVRPLLSHAIEALESSSHRGEPLLAELLTYLIWARIRTSHGPAVTEAFLRARALLGEHPGLSGLGTDIEAISAVLAWGAGDYGRMVEAAERARVRATHRGDPHGEAYALWIGAVGRHRAVRLRWDHGRGGGGAYAPLDADQESLLGEASSLLDRSTSILAARKERWFTASILYERAFNAKALGNTAAAIALCLQAYETRAEFGDARGVFDALLDLAGSHIDREDAAAAEPCCSEAGQIALRLGDPWVIAELDRTLAQLHSLRQEWQPALERAARAARVSLEIGSTNNILGSLRVVADVFLQTGEDARAAALYELVAAHPASPPFSRARAEAGLAALPDALTDQERELIRTTPLAEVAANVFHGVAASA